LKNSLSKFGTNVSKRLGSFFDSSGRKERDEKIAEQETEINSLKGEIAGLVDENNNLLEMVNTKNNELQSEKKKYNELVYQYGALENKLNEFKKFIASIRNSLRVALSETPSLQEMHSTVFSFLAKCWERDDIEKKEKQAVLQKPTEVQKPQIKVTGVKMR
jgi:myosin heavy subunit